MNLFVTSLKEKIKSAIKERRETAKSIYRVVLGEIDTLRARQANQLSDLSDDQCFDVVRKVVEKNRETISLLNAQDARAIRLHEENELLCNLLPVLPLTVAAIKLALEGKADEIRNAKNDGHANGVAVKYLKANNAVYFGDDVSQVVKQLRTPV